MNDRGTIPNDRHDGGSQLVPTAQSVPALRNPYGMPVGYADTVEDQPAPFGFNLLTLLKYWRILNKRKWLILSVAAAFVVLAAVRALMQTPLYTSTVRLQIDANVAKIVEGGDNVMPVEGGVEFMNTQYQLLRSHMMAGRVASALKLGDDPDFLKPREFSLFRTIAQMLS